MNNESLWTPKNGIEAFEQADTHVIKLGGEKSMHIAENLDNLLSPYRSGKNMVVVVSAFRSYADEDNKFRHAALDENHEGFDTNEHLACAAVTLSKGNLKTAMEILQSISVFYKSVAAKNITTPKNAQKELNFLTDVIGQAIDARIQALTGIFSAYHESKDTKKKIHTFNEDHILDFDGKKLSVRAFGDMLTRDVYAEFFRRRCYSPKIITFKEATEKIFKEPNLEALHVNTASSLRKVANGIRQELRRTLNSVGDTQSSGILIAEGYLPILGSQKGCSDKTSALLAVTAHSLGHRAINVIGQENPVLSIDPDLVDKEKIKPLTVKKMSYRFATETFAYQLRRDPEAFHPEALRMLEETNIDSVVLNPTAIYKDKMTLISNRFGNSSSKGVEIIGSCKNPTTIVISSGKAVTTHGYEACLSRWFADNGISIDQIITSACSVTYAFTENLPENKATELMKYINSKPELGDASVEIDETPYVSVYCIGNNIQRRGEMEIICRTLKEAKAEISYMVKGKPKNTLVMGVEKKYERELLALLHQNLIEEKETTHEIQRFGELWPQMSQNEKMEILNQMEKLAAKRRSMKPTAQPRRSTTPPALPKKENQPTPKAKSVPPSPKVPVIKNPGT